MEIPKEIEKLPIGWLNLMLCRCNNNIQFLRNSNSNQSCLLYNNDIHIVAWYDDSENMIYLRHDTIFLINTSPSYGIPFEVLHDFIKKVFPCAEHECEQVRRYDSKYCKHHHEYYSKLYGLYVSPETSSNHLNGILGEKTDDKKRK